MKKFFHRKGHHLTLLWGEMCLPKEDNTLSSKWISSIFVVITSILAIVLMVLHKYNWAVLAMTIMFAVSNIFRAKTFKEQGYEREAKWMQWMGIFFVIASIIVLVVIITG